MIVKSAILPAVCRSTNSLLQFRGISRSAPVFGPKHLNEDIVTLRSEFYKDKQEVARTPQEEPRYHKAIEEYVKNHRKQSSAHGGGAKSALSSVSEKAAIVPDRDISGSDGRRTSQFSTIKLDQMSTNTSREDDRPMIRANLEDISGWGAKWQQGGTGSQRNGFHFSPSYAQGMGDREKYIGYLKTNPLQHYPNRSRGIDSDVLVADHTKTWGKRTREINTKPIAYSEDDYHFTGFVDGWGNDRGRMQRWPSPQHVVQRS